MATTITTKHTFDIGAARAEHTQAQNHLSDVMDEVANYLSTESAELTSDQYADLRRSVHDAQDYLDAAYLALAKARRALFAAWHGVHGGDIVTTADGLTGKLVRHGSKIGWVDTGDRETHFRVGDIVSIERVEEVNA